jgi:hypothetical protein
MERGMKRSRRRASFNQRCVRAWLRVEGQIIRLLLCSDYRPCADGGWPVEYIKRITHRRWPRGVHLRGVEESPSIARWHTTLPADQWCEIAEPEPIRHS